MKKKNLEIPEALDMAILEYASKKQYAKPQKFIWVLRVAAGFSIAFICSFVMFNNSNNQPKEQLTYATKPINNLQNTVSSYSEYEQFDLALTKLDADFNAKVAQISTSLKSEMSSDLSTTLVSLASL